MIIDSNIDLLEKHHYIGLKYLFTQGCIMDFKLLFEDFPEKIIPRKDHEHRTGIKQSPIRHKDIIR
jgi:hypothetical protein